jgi:cyclic phosphodiesterase-like protein
MAKETAIVYWMVPAKSEGELFLQLIRILAKQFDAPQFRPHLTLLAMRDTPTSPRKVLERIKASPVRLRIRETAFSTKYTKSLFVRFASNKSLEGIVRHLGHALKTRAKPMPDPHVSLLYKNLPTRMKKELASAIKLPFAAVTFDSIQAVRTPLPIRDARDVRAWKVVATKRLSG